MLRSARLISGLTLVSRVLGLVRDMTCSAVCGAGPAWSAFWIAFQVPNLFRRLFGEGALSAAAIPVLTEKLSRDGLDAVDNLSGRLLGLLLVLLTAICVVAEVVVIGLWWAYRTSPHASLTLSLTAVTLPFMVLICAAALLGGLQNVLGRFGPWAAAPVILNLFMIAGAWWGKAIAPDHAIFVLAVAVVLSGVMQVAWMWGGLRRSNLRLRLSLDRHDPAIRRISLTMLPMVAGMSAVQLNTLVDSLIAGWFVPGFVGPAILSFAQRLYQFPLGVFAIALATAVFPTLSRHAADNDLAGLGRTLSKGIRVATFEGLPCLLGLILVREPLVRALFERGRFAESPDAAERVALALSLYALGVWAYGVNHLVVRAYYALGDVKTPLKVSLRNVVLNLVLNLLLVQTPLRESGLALATSICAVVQVAALLWRFERRIGHLEWRPILDSTLRAAVATAVMGAGVVLVNRACPAGLSNVIRLVVVAVSGAAVFLAAGWVVRSPELQEMIPRRRKAE